MKAKTGDWVFFTRELTSKAYPGDKLRTRKLQSKADGQYFVVATRNTTSKSSVMMA